MREQVERLERDLEALAQTTVFPATPDIAGAVRGRLADTRPRLALPRWAPAGIALAVLVFVVAVAASAAPAREAVADFFDRINIFETDAVPPDLPTEIQGVPVTLDEAGDRVGRTLALPHEPGGAALAPVKVLLQEYPQMNLKVVALFFEPEGGTPFVLFETNGGVGKGLGPGAVSEPVSGLGGEAYWLEGLRIVQLYDPAGNFVREAIRTTKANTLLWDGGNGVGRIEGDLTQEEAVRIAQSVH